MEDNARIRDCSPASWLAGSRDAHNNEYTMYVYALQLELGGQLGLSLKPAGRGKLGAWRMRDDTAIF
jgi:hypothetical protein